MEVIHRRVAGLDVHKRSVSACVRVLDASGRLKKEVRTFETMTDSLRMLRDWLSAQKVTHVAMESTGVYWMPIQNLLEGHFNLVLCNAKHVKQVPGRKTDIKDCEWLAKLMQHGLLQGSFVPSRAQRELRELTRTRAKLFQERTRVANRIHKVLEDANIKLASVASDVLGVSGQSMLRALIAGETDPTALAELARKQLRGKIPQLKRAMDGRVTDHHRFLLGLELDRYQHLTQHVERIDTRILLLNPPEDDEGSGDDGEELPLFSTSLATPGGDAEADTAPEPPPSQPSHALTWNRAVGLLITIPGVSCRAAETVLAEIGTDMSQFPTPGHLASWAGLCPGNNESAGKRTSGRTTHGNKWLKSALVMAARSASRTKTYLASQYRRIAARRGRMRAQIAVAHTVLKSIWYMLSRGVGYVELGQNYFDEREKHRVAKRLVTRLERLGHTVSLAPVVAPA